MSKIDFVILWVDGNDPIWVQEKNKYKTNGENVNSVSSNRFRDWDNLKYWFRGVEKNADWVNNIFFITYGHLPSWLNINNPKLKIIKHTDFIPKEYLPTFNSNTILLNLYRIPELSENFVIFNDDMFLIGGTKEKDFFNKDLPCDEFAINLLAPIGTNDTFFHMILNNIDIINKYFNKKNVIKNNFGKIFNIKYGSDNIRSILLIPWSYLTGFKNPHIAHSYKKSIFKEVAQKESERFDSTSLNKFRTNDDITEWLVRYWQLCSGNFYPRKKNFNEYFDITEDNRNIIKCIKEKKVKMICINDSDPNIDFEKSKNDINASFEYIFPKKSSFEI